MPNIFIGSAKSSNGLFQIDLSKWIIKYRYIFVAVFILAGILSTIKSFDNHANSDPLKYFTTNTKIRQSFDLAEKRLGSIRTHHIVIDSGQNHGIKDPAFLKAVDSFTREVLALDYVKKVNSILNIVKDMNQKLNNDQVSFHQVPDSNPHIAQLLLMYEMGSSADRGINHLVSMNRRKINMTINWKVETTQDSMIKNDQIISIAKKWGLDAHAAGTFSMIAGVNDKVVDSFYQSMGMAIILVSLVMLIVFRNFLYSTLAMLPNLVPLLFVGAYTATAGIFIDVGASIVFTICLGIAVDDTIHFMSQFILNKKNASTEEALSKTFLTSGEALILTTVVLVVGFGSFIFAKFLPNKNFGTLSSMVLLFALLTDLIFLPSILTIFNGKKQKA